MIADEMNMNQNTVHLILTEELGMRNICAKMVPMNLTGQGWEAQLSKVFDIQMHYGDAAASLFTWFRNLWYLFITKIKSAVKRHHFK